MEIEVMIIMISNDENNHLEIEKTNLDRKKKLPFMLKLHLLY